MVRRDDEDDVAPLTGKELTEFRDMLERDKRARWLWASLRTWAIWIAAVIGGITIGWDAFVKVVRSATGRD